MTLLTWVLIVLLIIAMIYIVVDKAVAWLQKRGGLIIKIVVEDDGK